MSWVFVVGRGGNKMFCFEYWCDGRLCAYAEGDDYSKILDKYMAWIQIMKESYSECQKDLYLVKLNNSIDDDEIIAEYHREGAK